MSYGLPHTTEVNRPFPKKQLFAKFGVKSAQRDRFDADISRMVISHEISSRSVPALASGDITAIYVVSVLIKRKDFDSANLELVYKLIPQRMVMAITLDDQVQSCCFSRRGNQLTRQQYRSMACHLMRCGKILSQPLATLLLPTATRSRSKSLPTSSATNC